MSDKVLDIDVLLRAELEAINKDEINGRSILMVDINNDQLVNKPLNSPVSTKNELLPQNELGGNANPIHFLFDILLFMCKY